jgi:phospholipase C
VDKGRLGVFAGLRSHVLLQFLEVRFGVPEPNIGNWRRAVCGDLTSAFDFSAHPDPDPNPPGVRFGASPRVPSLGAAIVVPASQTLPEGEPGTRLARALPYAFAVNVRPSGDKLRMDFANNGRAWRSTSTTA